MAGWLSVCLVWLQPYSQMIYLFIVWVKLIHTFRTAVVRAPSVTVPLDEVEYQPPLAFVPSSPNYCRK